jgi:hypothetical protein
LMCLVVIMEPSLSSEFVNHTERNDRMIRIWPRQHRTVIWPPRRFMTEIERGAWGATFNLGIEGQQEVLMTKNRRKDPPKK